MFDIQGPMAACLTSLIASQFLVALDLFRVRSGVGVWFIFAKGGEIFRLLCQVLQRDRLMFGPPLAKHTANRLIDALNKEPLEQRLGIHHPAPQRFRP